MSHFTVIVNPIAGRGHGEVVGGIVEQALKRGGRSVDVVRTTRRGHATELARAAQGDAVVCVGGDGTVNEVANGVIGTGKALGIVPAGSGNDFVKSVGIPKDVDKAIEIVLKGESRVVDAGRVATSEDETPPPIGPETRAFTNGIGIGFDATVAAKVPEIRYLKGLPQYLAAVFQVLGRYRSPNYRIVMDGVRLESTQLLMAIGNGTCAGGGFYLTPDAIVDDGLLDVCLIDDVGVGTILRLMPLVLLAKHRNLKPVKFKRMKEMTVSATDGFYVHADGEIVGRGVRSVSLRVEEGALKVIAPGR